MSVSFHRPGSSVKCSENDSLTDHPSYFRKLETVFQNNLTVNQHHVWRLMQNTGRTSSWFTNISVTVGHPKPSLPFPPFVIGFLELGKLCPYSVFHIFAQLSHHIWIFSLVIIYLICTFCDKWEGRYIRILHIMSAELLQRNNICCWELSFLWDVVMSYVRN
jgi:hypothetical protein